MWHEARKQEKKIRGLMVDYRKRAERRQNFYKRMKTDSTQFLQVHGKKCRIIIDPHHKSGNINSTDTCGVPWQGNKNNLIDRFDVRAHLDSIQPLKDVEGVKDISLEERKSNYERFRILVQNDFLGLSEEQFLEEMFFEEQFGVNAIGINSTKFANQEQSNISTSMNEQNNSDSESDVDIDASIEVCKLSSSQTEELNTCGESYGLKCKDFYCFLTEETDYNLALRMAKKKANDKSTRRDRKADVTVNKVSDKVQPVKRYNNEINTKYFINELKSKSPSPENVGEVTYITSFGQDDGLRSHGPYYASSSRRWHNDYSSSKYRHSSQKYSDRSESSYDYRNASIKSLEGNNNSTIGKCSVVSSSKNMTEKVKQINSDETNDKNNARERLKRKTQLLINKQYRADKKAEVKKCEKRMQQQEERNEEMRELTLKMRKKRREIRHKFDANNYSSD